MPLSTRRGLVCGWRNGLENDDGECRSFAVPAATPDDPTLEVFLRVTH
jgi:hypothetical protein